MSGLREHHQAASGRRKHALPAVAGEQHDLSQGALLSERPIGGNEVQVFLDGLLVIEVDHQPVLEAGPGAIFDPAMRAPYSKQHVTVRAAARCRLAVLPRDHLDSQALLGVAAEQTTRLRAHMNPPADSQ